MVCFAEEELIRVKVMLDNVENAMKANKNIVLESRRIPLTVLELAKKYNYQITEKEFYIPYEEACHRIDTDEFTEDTLRSWWRRYYPNQIQEECSEL